MQKHEGIPVGFIADKNPAFDAARSRVELFFSESGLNQLMKTLENLHDEIAKMPIADRFNEDRTIQQVDTNLIGRLNPVLVELGEKSRKRESLLLQATNLQGKIMDIASQLDMLIMDIEATKLD